MPAYPAHNKPSPDQSQKNPTAITESFTTPRSEERRNAVFSTKPALRRTRVLYEQITLLRHGDQLMSVGSSELDLLWGASLD